MELTLLTVYTEVHDTLGHTVGIGGHAAVGTVVAGPGAHDGDDGAVGANMDVVCRVDIGEGTVTEGVLVPWCQWLHLYSTLLISLACVCVQLTGPQMADDRVLGDSWVKPLSSRWGH